MTVRKGGTLRKAQPAGQSTGRTVARVAAPRPVPRAAPKPAPSPPQVESKGQQAADAVAEMAATRAEWPKGIPPWRVNPPKVPGLPANKIPEVLTEVPPIGTLVVIKRDNGAQVGTVGAYEHFVPSQNTFPVRWGAQTTMESTGTVWALPRECQPAGRRPPRRTGMCARLDAEAAQKRSKTAALPAQRARSPLVVEGTVLRAVPA